MSLLLALTLLSDVPAPQPGDLQPYLAIVADYASEDRTAALLQIRRWRPHQVTRAASALRRTDRQLRTVANAPDEIDFRTVEAAVLLHAESGLLALQDHDLPRAKLHLDTSVEILRWSRRAAAEARNWTTMRRHTFKDRPADATLEIRETIDERDFHVAVAAAALSLGFAETASPFAERARRDVPQDAEVQLLAGCVAASLAVEKALQQRDAPAARARAAAEEAFRKALALAPGTHEARLRLAKLLLDQERAREAETLLADPKAPITDDRQRYLARLFMARTVERRGRSEEAIGWYRHALAAWPGSQAARLGLAHAVERTWGPAAASRELAGAALDPSRKDESPDPWFRYPIGPPGLAEAAFKRVWDGTLRR